MATDPTERWEYVKARLFGHFGGLSYTGTPVMVYEGQHRERPDSARFFVRWSVQPLGSRFSGRASATKTAAVQGLLLVADVYAPTGEELTSYDAYQADRVASEVESAARDLDLTFQEYSTPASPTVVTSTALHFFTVTRRPRREVDGFAHVQVLAEGRWIASHAA